MLHNTASICVAWEHLQMKKKLQNSMHYAPMTKINRENLLLLV